MKANGQNLAEYSIVIGLVALVSMGALALFGQSISQGLGDTLAFGQSGNPAGSGLENTPQLNQGNPFPDLPGKRITIDLGNGKSLTLNYADPVAVAESSGGNGVTENALAVIKQMVAQLREQGEDEAKIVELEKLALEGQKIKSLQQQIEAKFPKEGFASVNERFNFVKDPANSIVVEGKEMTLLDASSVLSFTLTSDTYDSDLYQYLYNYNQNNTYTDSNYYKISHSLYYGKAGPLYDYMQQLLKVEDSGLLSNPVLKSLVKDDFSRQIFYSSNQTFIAPTQAEVGALVKTTRTSSNNICALSNSVTCQDRAG